MFKCFVAGGALLALPLAASAAQLVLTPANVIGSSGFYGDCCTFQPGSILDQQVGTVTETFGGGYWLNSDDGPANAYITIDLGSPTALGIIELYNTHNGPFGDRGSGDFAIYGSNAVLGGALVAPTLLLSDTLAAQGIGPVVAQAFSLGGIYRYISFNPTSVATGRTSCCGPNNYGLNELRIHDAAPEPQSWALMIIGFGLVGAVMRRRAIAAG